MGVSAQWRGHCPPARSRAETHDLCAHNVKAACGAMRGAWSRAAALPAPAEGGPSPAGKRRARTPPARGVPHGGRRGDRGQKSRIDKGWQQKDLQEATGLSQKYLSQVELDKVDPRFSVVKRIARALGVSLDTLAK